MVSQEPGEEGCRAMKVEAPGEFRSISRSRRKCEPVNEHEILEWSEKYMLKWRGTTCRRNTVAPHAD